MSLRSFLFSVLRVIMKYLVFALVVLFLIGCQAVENVSTEPIIPSVALATSINIPTPNLTPTSKSCPSINTELVFKLPDNPSNTIQLQSVLDYLNMGGDPQGLNIYFETMIEDINNDSYPEILAFQPNNLFEPFYLFTCINGEFKEQFAHYDTVGTDYIEVMSVSDLNKNGFPEVVVKEIGCFGLRCCAVFIVEWNGEKFTHLIKGDYFIDRQLDYADLSDPYEINLRDIDNDGIPELVWTGGIPPSHHVDHWSQYPSRIETHIYKWDGTNYAALPITYDAPEFRFQAVQDGDRFTQTGEYDKALSSYQLAIESDNLEWWTDSRWINILDQKKIMTCAERGTPCPPLVPDKKERPTLSAYSMFRIILVYLVRNQPDKAKMTYDELNAIFSSDNSVGAIVQLTTLFWNEFQTSGNLGSACSKAVDYIVDYPDILKTIGGSQYSFQDIDYLGKPEEICPFK